jgi:hypothetical protein
MRKPLERVRDFALRLQLASTLGAALDVRLERRNAEPLLAIEELVDFFGK